MRQNIKIFSVLSKDDKFGKDILNSMPNFEFKIFESFNQAYYSVYASPPNLIILFVEENIEIEPFRHRLKLIADMHLDSMLSNIPILFVLPDKFDFMLLKSNGSYDNEKTEDNSNNFFYIKDYIKRPFSKEEFLYKINSILHSFKSALDANPLTKLPGNSSIMEAVKSKLQIYEQNPDFDFSFSYIDIDNFKSYNDKYGFIRGDEILMMTSRLIATTVYDISKTRKRDVEKYVFIGHIGGDDFSFIAHNDDATDIGNAIINNFDKIILSFYDNTDKERGYIETYDRQNRLCKFLVMGLSIVIIPNVCKKITHYGQLSEIASSLKHTAKQQEGSKIIVDKRTSL